MSREHAPVATPASLVQNPATSVNLRLHERTNVLQVIGDKHTARGVKEALAEAGIMVRYYSKPELSMYVRISVGKPEHTKALQAALRAL